MIRSTIVVILDSRKLYAKLGCFSMLKYPARLLGIKPRNPAIRKDWLLCYFYKDNCMSLFRISPYLPMPASSSLALVSGALVLSHISYACPYGLLCLSSISSGSG